MVFISEAMKYRKKLTKSISKFASFQWVTIAKTLHRELK